MNIYEKMLAITEEVQNVEKKGFNAFSNYKYVRAVDVVEAIQKSIIKHGVFIAISELDNKISSEPRDKGGFNHYSDLKCHATFINAEKPEEKIEVEYFARASDTGDKDIYKAKTNGLKYLYTQQFMLVTDVLIDAEEEKAPKVDKLAPIPGNPVQTTLPKCADCGSTSISISGASSSVKLVGRVVCPRCLRTAKPTETKTTDDSKSKLPF